MNRIRIAASSLRLTALCAGAHAQTFVAREQVRAEWAQAVRTGETTPAGEGTTLRDELPPEAYPSTAIAAVGKTREEVRLELAEAIRTGDVVKGETGVKLNELYPKRYAGVRATSTLAKSDDTAGGVAAR